MQPPEVSADTRCVDDEVLLAFARGELDTKERAPVEAHLRDCSDCRAVLAEAARSLGCSPEPNTPRQIGRYEVQELLGAGASGVVYRAFDPNLKRTVAIKVLRRDVHGPAELSERMLREAQAMARLSAPTVVAVYDVGVEQGAVYLVMEYVSGGTLSAWLREPRSTEQMLAVFADAGRGLSAAHERGLVHLDFKPENVLVDDAGRARVTDFGLSRETDLQHGRPDLDPSGEAGLYAPTRGLVGTPAYMAPELFDGGRASAKSDQYAFGVALFTALFSRHPFGAGEGIHLAELIDRTHTRPPLSLAELGRSGRRDERLHALLTRALAVDPAARFPDLSALLGALSRASRTRFARPLLVLSASLLVLLVALGVHGLRTERRPTEPTPRVAAVPQPAPAAAQVVDTPEPRAPKLEPAEPKAPASKRRAARKKADVRYRDGLKDPF